MDWTSLATQIPLVVAFIWFALELQKRNQASLDKRDEAYLEALSTLTAQMREVDAKNEQRLHDHDCRTIETDRKIDQVIMQTKPRPRTR